VANKNLQLPHSFQAPTIQDDPHLDQAHYVQWHEASADCLNDLPELQCNSESVSDSASGEEA